MAKKEYIMTDMDMIGEILKNSPHIESYNVTEEEVTIILKEPVENIFGEMTKEVVLLSYDVFRMMRGEK